MGSVETEHNKYISKKYTEFQDCLNILKSCTNVSMQKIN